jgi:LDH2 family malate/lactate/ureidoglycolate dehydrogenase
LETLPNERVRLTHAEAQALGEQALRRIGYDADEAKIIADHCIDAGLCGYEYSGLPKILNVAEHKRVKLPRRPMSILHETPISTQFDGGNNNGMVTMFRATQAVIEKASRSGFAVVGVNNSWMSGRSAYYVEMAARAGLIAIHTVSSHLHVAAPGSKGAATGTNPVAFGFPTENEPFVIDLGTSAFMGTDLIFRERTNALLPDNVALDADGNVTRDASKVAVLLPFGGYKGFALSLAMQAMGLFASGGLSADRVYGYMIMAMKPDLLTPMDQFRRDMSAMLARVKATPRQSGVDEIRLPGERSQQERARLRREGLEIDLKIYEALRYLPQGKLP